jgi:hypothetical protein
VKSKSLLVLASAGLLLLGACGGDEAGATPDTEDSVAAPDTRHVVVTNSPKAPVSTISPQLITHCVEYVPFAAFTGNFYMRAIWNIANQNVDTLRTVCEEMGHTDPAGLQRISDEKQAVDRYFASFTTVPGAAPAAGAPGASGCVEGAVMTDTGHCQTTGP